MTRGLRRRVGSLVFACLLLLGGAAEIWAQVRVYNPGRYSGTRRVMSSRAAARAAQKKKKQRQKARRKTSRRTVS